VEFHSFDIILLVPYFLILRVQLICFLISLGLIPSNFPSVFYHRL
jgi:hypothetical protein